MLTYKYEAVDTSGGEVKDSVEAMNEKAAHQKIRQMGYFVTKITEVAARKAGKGKAARKAPVTGEWPQSADSSWADHSHAESSAGA